MAIEVPAAEGLAMGASRTWTTGLWGYLRELRPSDPVLKGTGGRLAGLPEFPNIFSTDPDQPTFMTLRYEDNRHVLASPDLFRPAGDSGGPLETALGPRSLPHTEDPYHAKLRALIMPVLRKSTLDRWREEYIEPKLTERLNSLRRKRTVDLQSEFMYPFPFSVTAGVLGFSEEIHDESHRLLSLALNSAAEPEVGHAAGESLRRLMEQVLDQWQADPGNNLVSDLLTAEVNGQKLERSEVLSLMQALLAAAGDTTHRNGTMLLYALLTHPHQLADVRSDPSLLRNAVEEQLRWEPGGAFVARVAKADVELSGTFIPSGSLVMACLTMANRDPERWSSPDEYDLHRESRPYLSFGAGPHTCPGQHLGKAIILAGTQALIAEFPDMHLNPEYAPPEISGVFTRTPGGLHAVLN